MRSKTLQWKLTVVILVIQFVSMSSVGVLYLIAYYLNFEPVVRLAKSPLMVPLVFFTVAMVLSALIAIPVTRFFLRPLKQLSEATLKVQKGDFNAEVEVPPGRGDFSDLFSNFNQMTKELRGTELFRSDFINNFSHEFKTPIVSIRGFAKQLQLDDTLSEEQKKEYIEFIVKESDRLSSMANNILLLSKLENQQYVTNRSTFYMDELIRHAVLLFEKQWTEKDLELELDLCEAEYTTDEYMLEQVFVNLLSNAIKFNRPGGRLCVTLKKEREGLRITVEDSGDGIDEKNIQRIFDKFYQADPARVTQGNGLGLALVKRIVELLGGKISVRSEKGKGSAFTVILPYEEKAA